MGSWDWGLAKAGFQSVDHAALSSALLAGNFEADNIFVPALANLNA
ncbi:hypothetical protein [Xanthomonas fragariae]|nr:hypothetical protein [Xanthomonas fragariae]